MVLFVWKHPFSYNRCLLRPNLIKRSNAQTAPTPTFALKTVNIYSVGGFQWFFHDGLESPRGEFSDEEDESEDAGERSWLSCLLGSAAAPPAQRDEGHLFSTGSQLV